MFFTEAFNKKTVIEFDVAKNELIFELQFKINFF